MSCIHTRARAERHRCVRAATRAQLVVIATSLVLAACAPPPAMYRTVDDSWGESIRADRVDVAYGAHTAQRLDIYLAAAGPPRGTVVFVHGGGWNAGDKSERNARPNALLAQTRRGYGFVTINYRLAGQASHPGAVQDIATAINWVRSNGPAHGLDPSTIILAGYSAGAHLATLAAVSANNATPAGAIPAVDAVVALAGAFELGSVPDAHLPGLRSLYPSAADRRDASPVRWLDAQDPPMFVVHGVEDGILPVAQLHALRTRAGQVGATRKLTTVEVSDHRLQPGCRNHAVSCGVPMDQLDRFLDRL